MYRSGSNQLSPKTMCAWERICNFMTKEALIGEHNLRPLLAVHNRNIDGLSLRSLDNCSPCIYIQNYSTLQKSLYFGHEHSRRIHEHSRMAHTLANITEMNDVFNASIIR